MIDPKDLSLTDTLTKLGLIATAKYGQSGRVVRERDPNGGTGHGRVVVRGTCGEVWAYLEAEGLIVATGRTQPGD